MPVYKKPDIYIEEISKLPPSVAEVETAIPAFIGYTSFATRVSAGDLLLVPKKIFSLKDFETYYGYPNEDPIAVVVRSDNSGYVSLVSVTEPSLFYFLYFSVRMFFDNGGGACYIVSVGTFQTPTTIRLKGDSGSNQSTKYGLMDGLDKVALFDEPTLIIIPEAVKLSANDYSTLVQAVLLQCSRLGDRFAIFDLYDGGNKDADFSANRNYFGSNSLKYGAVYYPFIRTSMNFYLKPDETNVFVTYSGGYATLDKLKSSNMAVYNFVIAELKNHFVVIPPGGAIAGVYTATDRNRGVWKAPANLRLTSVIEPICEIDKAHQDVLNVDAITGKSINAICAFPGKGTLVWGARTLAGNDNEWRYIAVRRFFNMEEESLRKSTGWVVFEPNDANTWVKVRAMIENYLILKWQQGALAGSSPKEAFFVHCGLGTTMTVQDILEGRINVEIGMAAVRPAEFIILKFSQKLVKS